MDLCIYMYESLHVGEFVSGWLILLYTIMCYVDAVQVHLVVWAILDLPEKKRMSLFYTYKLGLQLERLQI